MPEPSVIGYKIIGSFTPVVTRVVIATTKNKENLSMGTTQATSPMKTMN
jgi:hypothetical protein